MLDDMIADCERETTRRTAYASAERSARFRALARLLKLLQEPSAQVKRKGAAAIAQSTMAAAFDGDPEGLAAEVEGQLVQWHAPAGLALAAMLAAAVEEACESVGVKQP